MKNSFERGKDVKEALKVGKFRDCIKVYQVYHRNHDNAKYGTHCLFNSVEEEIKALEVMESFSDPAVTNIPYEKVNLTFKTDKGLQCVFELEGNKIVYRNRIYKLPTLHVEP